LLGSIVERIGWERGLTALKDPVRGLRPRYLPPDPASRTPFEPGEFAQCDFWFPQGADGPLQGPRQNRSFDLRLGGDARRCPRHGETAWYSERVAQPGVLGAADPVLAFVRNQALNSLICIRRSCCAVTSSAGAAAAHRADTPGSCACPAGKEHPAPGSQG
jgi:hypothetical protein